MYTKLTDLSKKSLTSQNTTHSANYAIKLTKHILLTRPDVFDLMQKRSKTVCRKFSG